MRNNLLNMVMALLLIACGSPQVPSAFTETDQLPDIYPDYLGVTIPVNMAPLHFQLMDVDDDTEVVTRFSAAGQTLVCGGRQVRPSLNEWKQLAQAAKGQDITVEVFVEGNGGWSRFKPFKVSVSTDSIDSWLSYRLISPSYVAFEELTINQRCLESFEERVIYNNMLNSTEQNGQCINCHSYQRGNPDRMQFHARINNAGTLISHDGQLRKVNLKTDSTISAGVYPAWHPTLSLIAYSTDITKQLFHTYNINKVEVFDQQSDLILYDIERNEVHIVEDQPDELEIFPTWSPDGQWLYYCSAHFALTDSTGTGRRFIDHYKEIKYNVYRKKFNEKTLDFGPRELVFDAAAQGLSATLPRISPDGQWLMLSVGEWGCFHIWHQDADLWLMNLHTQETSPWTEVNSDQVEGYHTWSQSGRWIVFSSRRYDGNFSRPFFAHVDEQGHATKPFELPCDNPDDNRQLLRSYNIPELMTGPVTVTPLQFAETLKGAATQAVLKSK